MSNSHLYVATVEKYLILLEQLSRSTWVGLDTEFISEGRYQPQLCLVQIAYEGGLAIIDPTAIHDLSEFWKLLCDGRREVIAHAARGEMEFCYRAIHKLPEWLFDIQIAAGFVGIDYPIGFRNLVDRLLDIEISKGETRTDWLKRPLTNRQIEYALNDVRYLYDMAKILKSRLKEHDRFGWFQEDALASCYRLQQEWEKPKWRTTAKCSSLPPREQAIVRELWFWRDRVAKKTNQISTRVLRDDLIIELAKLNTSEPQRISTIRGMTRPDLVRQYESISRAIARALSLDRSELPEPAEKQSYPQYHVIVQFLYTAFNMICKQNRFSTSLVGTQNDVREYVAFLYGTLPDGMISRLSRGWRSKLVGSFLRDLLEGKISMKLDIESPEEPIVFVESNGE